MNKKSASACSRSRLDKGNEAVKENFEAGESRSMMARKVCLGSGLKRRRWSTTVLKRSRGWNSKSRIAQARIYMTQARSQRPDVKKTGGDWMKAADAYKNAATIFRRSGVKEETGARRSMRNRGLLSKRSQQERRLGAGGRLLRQCGGCIRQLERQEKPGRSDFETRIVHRSASTIPRANVQKAASLYGRAATLFGDVGNKTAATLMEQRAARRPAFQRKKILSGSHDASATTTTFKRARVDLRRTRR